jgi:hypothetical protein
VTEPSAAASPEPERIPAAVEPAPEAAPVGEPAVAQVPPTNVLPTIADPKSYTMRFALAYVGLGLALAAAITGLIVLVIRPGHHDPPPWSVWKPTTAATTAGSKEIAEHISQQYRLAKGGPQLLAVVPSNATVTSGTNTIQIKAIAIRKAPQSNTGIVVIPNPKTEMYQLCGLGQNCSIAKGTATATRGRLVRREALELALYTFKFIPAVDSVAAFMPPPPGQSATNMIYLQKSDLKDLLRRPLSETLPAAKTPLPTDEDTVEATAIDRLTLPNLFTYSLTALQGGGAALILDPAQ